MDKKPDMAVPNLVKPIIHFFANEKCNAKYRQFLSDPENFKKNQKVFRDFIYSCIDHMAKYNIKALDATPPKDESNMILS